MEYFRGVNPKHSSEEALERWRSLCSAVKQVKRRFRFTANSGKKSEAKDMQKSNQRNLRVAFPDPQAAYRFIDAGPSVSTDYQVPEEVKAFGFGISADELASIVEGHDLKKLRDHSGIEGISEKLSTSITDGIVASEESLKRRQEVYGFNRFVEKPPRFWMFVWEAHKHPKISCIASYTNIQNPRGGFSRKSKGLGNTMPNSFGMVVSKSIYVPAIL